MEGSPTDSAWARIDAAMARIEAAAARPPAGDTHLAARHEQLRATVADTMRALDGLIAAQQQ